MKVGIICEGSTDFAIIEALAIGLVDAEQCVALQPDYDRLKTGDSSAGGGWQNVRKFLHSSAPGLALGTFDIVIVHVDASIRKLDELKGLPAARSGEPELTPLCEHVKSWAKGGLPPSAIIALPREDLETWLVAAHTRLKNVEAIESAAAELAARGLIAVRKNGAPDKKTEQYRSLAKELVVVAADRKRRGKVAELDRFVNKLDNRARAVKPRKRPATD